MQTSDPTWLRAVTVVAALAGLRGDDITVGFSPDDAAVLTRRLAALRAVGGDRSAIAQAIVREQRRVTRPPRVPDDGLPGAGFLASWMKTLGAPERAVVARGLDAATLRAVTAVVPRAQVPADGAIAAWLVMHARDVATRLPSATEWTGVLQALVGDAHPTALGAQIERRVRVAGRGARCRSLALEMLG